MTTTFENPNKTIRPSSRLNVDVPTTYRLFLDSFRPASRETLSIIINLALRKLIYECKSRNLIDYTNRDAFESFVLSFYDISGGDGSVGSSPRNPPITPGPKANAPNVGGGTPLSGAKAPRKPAKLAGVPEKR